MNKSVLEFKPKALRETLNKSLTLLGVADKQCYGNFTTTEGAGKKLPLFPKVTKGKIYIMSRTKPTEWDILPKAIKALGAEGSIYKGGKIFHENVTINGVFVMTDLPKFNVIVFDLDHVKNGENIDPIATEIIENLPGIAEWSMSKTGIHLFCKVPSELTERTINAIKALNPGKKSNGEIMCDIFPYADNQNIHIEIYAKYRGIAMTGDFLNPLPSELSSLSLSNIEFLEKLIARDTKKNKPYDLKGALEKRGIPHIYYDGGFSTECFEIPCVNRTNHTDRSLENAEGIEEGTGKTLVWMEEGNPLPQSKCMHEHCTWITSKDQLNQNGRPDLPSRAEKPKEKVEEINYSYYQFPYVNMKGNPIKGVKENVVYYLQKNKIEIKENDISHRAEIIINNKVNDLQDYHITKIASELNKLNFAISTKQLLELCLLIAHENNYNPVIEWYNTLEKWDHKTDYVKELFDILNPENPDICYPLFHKWALQSIYLLHNGLKGYEHIKPCTMLILKGKQGIGKGNFIMHYYPEQFLKYVLTEQKVFSNKDNAKDECITITSGILTELSEFARSLSSMDALKAFLTSHEDRIRRPYGRLDIITPRRTNFIGTINDNKFFCDNTGNRRFIVLDLSNGIDWNTINEFYNSRLSLYHSQLFTEFLEGVTYEPTKEEINMLLEINSKYSVINEMEQFLYDNYDFNQSPVEKWMSATEIFTRPVKSFTMKGVCKTASLSALGRTLTNMAEQGKIIKNTNKHNPKYLLPPVM